MSAETAKNANLLDLIPGILLALVISVPATFIHLRYTTVSAVAIAIIAGIIIRTVFGLPQTCKPGVGFAVKKILRLGIVLLGAGLSFREVLKTGASALGIIVVCITAAIFLVYYLSIRIGLPDRLGTLIGVGTSICGVSAIVATAPAIEANEEETAFAVTTITLFGLLAVIVYPVLGRLLHLSDAFFGTWAGTAVNDTSQVLATGFIFSDAAGKVATVVKLTRNLFMAPVIIILSSFYLMKKAKAAGGGSLEKRKLDYQKAFPVFVLGFAGMAVLRTIGFFSPEGVDLLKTTSAFLITTAIAGVGLGTNFAAMKKIGLKPFYAGLAAALIMAGISFGLLKLFNVT